MCKSFDLLLGLVMIILGLLFWIGNALNLIGLHMLLGITLVLLLWALAIMAARSGVSLGLVALGIAWGLIVVALGMTQNRLLPGDAHWVIKVLHLLVGIAYFTNFFSRSRRSSAAEVA